ncbi:MAG: sulfotransferase, partial [Deltaproteobacteria bacterium]|nr:sulfotransferase [Deltaproteobacteria bacterium]
KFLNETTEFWTSSLQIDVADYTTTLIKAFFDLALCYQRCSEDYGYDRWGIKQPLRFPNTFNIFHQFMPKARFVFIYRNLFDVARSAKARRWINTSAEVAQLASQWQTNLLSIVRRRPERVIPLRYENLVANPGPHIAQLERFTETSGIDRTVMDRKFNTFAGPGGNGQSPSQYVEPQELSPDETDILSRAASEALAATGYADNKSQ